MSETQNEQFPQRVDQTQMPDNGGMNIDLMEYLYRLLAGWKLILCLALVGAIGYGLYTHYRIAPVYQAKATIYVVSRKDSVINMSDLSLGSALTGDYIKVFKTWELQERVLTALDLPYSYSALQSMVSVTNDSGTRMLDITAHSTDPQLAADIANEYARQACDFIADVMSTDRPNIMSVALKPTNPISPNKTKNILTGFLAGMIIACGIIFLQMISNDRYHTAEDIRKYTGLITLAIVPVNGSGSRHTKKYYGKGAKYY